MGAMCGKMPLRCVLQPIRWVAWWPADPPARGHSLLPAALPGLWLFVML